LKIAAGEACAAIVETCSRRGHCSRWWLYQQFKIAAGEATAAVVENWSRRGDCSE